MAACDAQDMDCEWRRYLDEKYENVPLHALRYSATRRIGMCLNQKQVMHNDIVPDFGGLAELVGFDGVEIKNFERVDNPGKAVLDEWMKRPELDPTIGHLVKLLAVLGREDILTDCQDMIGELHHHIRGGRGGLVVEHRLPTQKVPSSNPGCCVPYSLGRVKFLSAVIEGRQINYDAFVCFNAFGESGKDFEFVKELIRRFENPPFNFKLFIPHRDDLAGLAQHDINATIISERCRHMIVVLSNNFMESPACAFQSAFAHSLSPGAKSKRLVPVVIEEMNEMPNIMRIMSYCDFTKKILYDWSWERLAKSISVPLSSEDYRVRDSVGMDGFLSQRSPELSSSFLPPEPMHSPSPSTDSGWGSNHLASSSPSENLTSGHQSAPPAQSHGTAAGTARQATDITPVQEPGGNEARSPTARPGTHRPSSPGLGSRALKKLKQTFSSDKRKSGSQTGL
ncbi:hypothetical protein EGW08_005719 [Elysia chlorotica]|uniref:TIR domain-containing protein n=1 Tax=Elysia chlorotica TaxID=188477 RepID=A0A3S1BLL8_ELYCH|nr:hypothetical protein EGW08_005719 [Elysia chlorotica]